MTEGHRPDGGIDRIVRRAESADLDVLVTLRALMFTAMGASGVEDPAWRDAARRWFDDRLDAPTSRIVVVEMGGQVVASAVGLVRDSAPSPSVLTPGDVLIHNVATLPGHRRRGHSRAATRAVLDWAGQLGVGRVELLATTDGEPLYRELGFTGGEFPVLRRPLP